MCGVLAPFCGSGLDVAVEALRVAGVGVDDVVFDLGCGDGDVLIASASVFKAFTVGVEINPRLCRRAWVRVREAGLQHLAQVVCGDLTCFPLFRANVIYMYLTSRAYMYLRDKVNCECKPGVRIVTYNIPIPYLEADEIVEGWVDDKPYTIYLYRVGKHVDGGGGLLDLYLNFDFLRFAFSVSGGFHVGFLNKVLD